MDFAGKLAALMAAADDGQGVGQNELHRRSGVPQRTISGYLNRVNRPSWAHVQALATALGVDYESLTDDPDTITRNTEEPTPRIISKRK